MFKETIENYINISNNLIIFTRLGSKLNTCVDLVECLTRRNIGHVRLFKARSINKQRFKGELWGSEGLGEEGGGVCYAVVVLYLVLELNFPNHDIESQLLYSIIEFSKSNLKAANLLTTNIGMNSFLALDYCIIGN